MCGVAMVPRGERRAGLCLTEQLQVLFSCFTAPDNHKCPPPDGIEQHMLVLVEELIKPLMLSWTGQRVFHTCWDEARAHLLVWNDLQGPTCWESGTSLMREEEIIFRGSQGQIDLRMADVRSGQARSRWVHVCGTIISPSCMCFPVAPTGRPLCGDGDR